MIWYFGMPRTPQLQQWLRLFTETSSRNAACFNVAMALVDAALLAPKQQDDRNLQLLEALKDYSNAALGTEVYASLTADKGDVHV
jgi:hypothetical protein